MEMVPDDSTEGFSYIWKIQNFSYCLQKKGELLSSPSFKLNSSDNYEWCLDIFPRGSNEDDTIGIFLKVKSNSPFPIKVERHFSVQANNDVFKRRRNEDASIVFEQSTGFGYHCFLNYRELYKNGGDGFLKNDTLTLRCRIWKVYPELAVHGKCFARTVIDVKRIAFVWWVRNFEELLSNKRKTYKVLAASSQTQSFIVDIFLSGEIYTERKMQVEIKLMNASPKRFWTCKLSLLNTNGKTDHSVQDDHWFEDSQETQNWHFTIMPVKKILDRYKLYVVKGTLSLRCEFAISCGVKYNETEEIEYGVTEEHEKACYSETVDEGYPRSWKGKLQQILKEGKFSDVTIRTASGKKFPVHKDILSEGSKLFSAMFELDTKENRTGIVEIEDLKDDTVSKMLLFLYTDIVEDLNWQTALELHYAAYKYGMVGLKRECCTFLKANLNISNAREVLFLADTYWDHDMKQYALDFIIDRVTEILNSES